MHHKTLCISTFALLSSLALTVGQAKYSGIYSGTGGGIKFLAAVTAGGRILALDNNTEGLRDAVDPAKSTIDSKGVLKAAVPNGTTLTGNINSSFQMSGTIKSGKQSIRFSAKRIFK